MVITMSTLCKGSFTKSLILMDSSDVAITTTMGCEGSITKITPESLTLMDNFDVHISTTTGCKDSFTKITAEFFSPMDSSDVHIMTTTGCEGSVTFTATMYFLHFYINTGELLMVWCSILYCYILRSTLCRVV